MSKAFNHSTASNDLGLPEGWFDESDVETYKSLVQELPTEGRLVEIGVWQGRSLCSIAKEIIDRKLRVIAIDTFKGTNETNGVVHDCNGKLRDVFDTNLKEFGIQNYVEIISMPSITAASFVEESADLVFIDSDHRRDAVVNDIKTWLPKVKSGGVLAGHDYTWVGEFVVEALGTSGSRLSNDGKNIWYFLKN